MADEVNQSTSLKLIQITNERVVRKCAFLLLCVSPFATSSSLTAKCFGIVSTQVSPSYPATNLQPTARINTSWRFHWSCH